MNIGFALLFLLLNLEIIVGGGEIGKLIARRVIMVEGIGKCIWINITIPIV